MDKQADVVRGDLVEIQMLYEAIQEQRRSDLGRLRSATLESDRLRADLAERFSYLRPKEGNIVQVDVKNVLLRLKDGEVAGPVTLVNRFLAAMLLRLARNASANRKWAQAEIYYQCIALLRPRIFLWKQVGNMLFQQNVYAQAAELFEKVIENAPDDEEANFFLARCRENLGQV